MMLSVVLIGSGNVAFHLANALIANKEIDLRQVYGRNTAKWQHLKGKTKITNNLKEIDLADIYIISVSDNAIKEVSEQLPPLNGIVVHTSGSTSIDILQHPNKGIIYPLQTFSKEKEIDFQEIPICIEGNSTKTEKTLQVFAQKLSKKVFFVNSEQRKKLHLSAVFVCNFVNHLYYLGQKLCEESNLPFEILQPLIGETAEKIKLLSPFEAQTGPAKRMDTQTIEKHLSLLEENQKNIYNPYKWNGTYFRKW